jgi:hypothetical protein
MQATPGSIALPHQSIDQLDRSREFVSYVDDLLRGHNLMTLGQDRRCCPSYLVILCQKL